MQMTTKEMAQIMDWIAKGQITAREFAERMLIMETTIREHVQMCQLNRLIKAKTDDDENPNQEERPPIEWMKIFLEELRMMRDYERELRDRFCIEDDEDLIKALDSWWSSALGASTKADGTTPEPGDGDPMTFADIVNYPLRKLSDALYDCGLDEDSECEATVENLTKLAKELGEFRDEAERKRLVD